MPFWLSQGALLQCTMGVAPCPLKVLPLNKVMADAMPLATIMDNKPFVNIGPFGLCKSPLNPAVAAIIAASLGSVTKGPCIPMCPAPWIPGNPMVMAGMMPSVSLASQLVCAYGGMISPKMSGQMSAMT